MSIRRISKLVAGRMIQVMNKNMVTFMLAICTCYLLYNVLSRPRMECTTSFTHNLLTKPPRLSTTKPSVEPAVKRILLVTYGRSGSTFTSYILKETKGAFFFFEPLRPLLMRTTSGYDTIVNYEALGGKYFEPGELPTSNLTSYERASVLLMEYLLNCEISKFPIRDYFSSHLLVHGDSATMSRCLMRTYNSTPFYIPKYLQCLLTFSDSCQTAHVRIFKVIRLPLRSLFGLMRKFPDLRVVYLVRDPRAILTSQRTMFGNAANARDFCRMVMDDVSHIKILQKKFPGRAFTVRYEDISSDPLEWTRRLYKALHLDLTSKVVKTVRRMTSAPHKYETNYSIFRSNPKLAANKWRTKVEYADVRYDDVVCAGAYHRLGYKRALSESVLRNLNVSLTGPPFGLSLL